MGKCKAVLDFEAIKKIEIKKVTKKKNHLIGNNTAINNYLYWFYL